MAIIGATANKSSNMNTEENELEALRKIYETRKPGSAIYAYQVFSVTINTYFREFQPQLSNDALRRKATEEAELELLHMLRTYVLHSKAKLSYSEYNGQLSLPGTNGKLFRLYTDPVFKELVRQDHNGFYFCWRFRWIALNK